MWRPFSLFLVALAAYVPSAWAAVTASENRLLQVVPDDAFYYLQIAHNVVRLGESTADGYSVTNGYHPLWMGVSVLLAWLFPIKDELLRAAVCTSLVLHAVVALLLYRSLLNLVGPSWAWIAAGCWILNPLAYVIALQTVEATTYAAALLAAFVVHLRVSADLRGAGVPMSSRRLVAYGASLGVVCLARTEGVVVAGLALLWLATRIASARYSVKRRVVEVLIPAVSMSIVLLPWALFSLSQVGTVVQDSGAMKMLWAADLHPGLRGRLSNLLDTGDYIGRSCIRLMTTWNVSRGELIAVVALLGPTLAVMIRRAPPDQASALRSILVSTCAIGLVYGLTVVERQIWWLAAPCLSIFLLVFIALAVFFDSVPGGARQQRWTGIALLGLSAVAFVTWHVKAVTPYPWQPDVKRSQRVIEARVPASEPIGSLNAGIPMFFGTRRVIALDGLVSHDARMRWTARRFDAFLAERRIQFIADEPHALKRALRFSRVRPVLRERASYPLSGWPTKRVLWQVVGP